MLPTVLATVIHTQACMILASCSSSWGLEGIGKRLGTGMSRHQNWLALEVAQLCHVSLRRVCGRLASMVASHRGWSHCVFAVNVHHTIRLQKAAAAHQACSTHVCPSAAAQSAVCGRSSNSLWHAGRAPSTSCHFRYAGS